MASWQRYNPNYGKGVTAANAWKLSTVRGGEWYSNKVAENGGGCPPTTAPKAAPKPTVDDGFKKELENHAGTKQGITKKELAQVLGDYAAKGQFGELQRKTLAQLASTDGLFAREKTRQLALQIAGGLDLSVAAIQFGLVAR